MKRRVDCPLCEGTQVVWDERPSAIWPGYTTFSVPCWQCEGLGGEWMDDEGKEKDDVGTEHGITTR